MEEGSEKEIECPVCLNTLRKPIRMLSCGHNFCHGCIKNCYCPGIQNRCPFCRELIEESFDRIPRNITLENLIENMTTITPFAEPPTPTIIVYSGDAVKQLEDSIEAFMSSREYSKALQTLQTLIAQVEGIYKVLATMKKIKCQIEIGEDATETCVGVASILKQPSYFQSPPMPLVYQLDDEFRIHVELFIDINLDTALLFQRCRFDLTNIFYKGEIKLRTLNSVGDSMQRIANKIAGNKFKQEYSFMDMVVGEMQAVMDADVKFKAREIAWFMKYYGYCCNQLKDYDKSVELHEKAIFMVETVFGGEATCDIKLFPILYNNLGIAYENSNKVFEAEKCFAKALRVCPQIKTFQNEEERLELILLLSKSYRRVETKLQSSQRENGAV